MKEASASKWSLTSLNPQTDVNFYHKYLWGNEFQKSLFLGQNFRENIVNFYLQEHCQKQQRLNFVHFALHRPGKSLTTRLKYISKMIITRV